MIDGSEALKGLITIIGSGGLVTIIGAYLAFRSEAHKGRRGDPDGRGVALSITKDDAPSLDKAAIEGLTSAVGTMNGLLLRIAAMIEREFEDREERREKDLERRERDVEARERDISQRGMRMLREQEPEIEMRPRAR